MRTFRRGLGVGFARLRKGFKDDELLGKGWGIGFCGACGAFFERLDMLM